MNSAAPSLKQAFEEIHNSLPELLCSGPEKPTPFPKNKKAMIHERKEELLALRLRCQEGLQLIIESMTATDQTQATALSQILHEKFASICNPSIFTLVVLGVVAGKSWREAFKIPKESCNALYEEAKKIFEEGKFQEAISCFIFLTWLDGKQYDFWIALGHSYYHSANHCLAVKAYEIASHTNPNEVWPHIYSALCFEALCNQEEAKESILKGLEKAKQHGDEKLSLALQQKIEKYKQEPITPIS